MRPSTGHPFWVKRGDWAGAWIAAGEMRVGDLVQTIEGQWKRVVAITPEKDAQTVYNFTVDLNHDYFVGDEGFLVHNAGPCKPCQVFPTYRDFKNASTPYDGLQGHELWQFANQKALDLAERRLSGFASSNNPVIALGNDLHADITAAQAGLNPAGQSAIENIMANAQILRDKGVPEDKVNDLLKRTLQHAEECRQ